MTYKYKRQELYLNKVDAYVKSAAQRKERIDYIVKEKYNGVRMYGMNTALDDSTFFTPLRDYINELRAAGCIRVGTAYSSTNFIQLLNKFNDGSSVKFDSVISEIEPWRTTAGVSWQSFFSTLGQMRTWAHSEAKPLEASFYEGWPNKPDGTNFSDNVSKSIMNVDVGYLHCYVFGKPVLKYMTDTPRLQEFALQAHLLGFSKIKKLKVITILSSEQEFSGPYFSTHSPVDCYTSLVKEFNAASFPYKECLDFNDGFIVFKESDIRKYRP